MTYRKDKKEITSEDSRKIRGRQKMQSKTIEIPTKKLSKIKILKEQQRRKKMRR